MLTYGQNENSKNSQLLMKQILTGVHKYLQPFCHICIIVSTEHQVQDCLVSENKNQLINIILW